MGTREKRCIFFPLEVAYAIDVLDRASLRGRQELRLLLLCDVCQQLIFVLKRQLNTRLISRRIKRLQHQIDPKNEILFSKLEKKLPLCTSYIVASLQYQTKMANYHLQAMDMCLSLFNTASDDVMKTVASMDMEIIGLFWIPIEFVGDFNTQKMCLKLIVKILSYLDETQKRQKLNEIKTSAEIRSLLLKLTANEADFEKISRELLNNFNMKTTKNCAVFSVYCRSALFGCYELFRPKDVDRFWIDFNYATKSVSVLCDVKLKNGDKERISIQIKIDKLQIENQFDCIVLSIEPATFSKTVSTELSNARIAVFTLPQSEVQRLLANRDLIDFYNKTSSYPSPDLMEPGSQNTIDNFLAEQQEEGESLEKVRDVALDVAEGPILEERTLRRQTTAQCPLPKAKKKTTLSASVIKQPEVSKKSTNKESGCNPGTSVPNQDSATFKIPAKPVRQIPPDNSPSKGPQKASQHIGTVKKRKKSGRSRNASVTQRTCPQLSQSSKAIGTTSKRFFKGGASKPPDLPRTQTIPKPRKKPSNIRCSGVSPKRKQVNTVRPLNHLTQPNCDPQEAALEYVENGGYANIISFIQSSAGLASFNDQQRQQILENVEKINEDLDRSSRHFFPKALSNGSGSSDEDDEDKSRQKKKKTPKGAESNKFIPFSTWKVQQRQKSNASPPQPKELVPAKTKVVLNAFDRLKDNEKDVTVNQLTTGEASSSPLWDALNSKYPSSSDSSGSNHNFLIVESDNELEGLDMDISAADMECRHEPQDMDLSLVPTPKHTAHAEDTTQPKKTIPTSSQGSLSSSVSKIGETPLCGPDPEGIISELAEDWASDYQPSEIFEDLDEEPPNKEPHAEVHANESEYSSEGALFEDPEDLHKETKLRQCELESNHNEEATSQCENNSPTISPREARGSNSWYIEKYLNDQQLFNQSPINVEARSAISPPDPRPSVVTTNQVIIQNQIVVAAGRKRPSPPHDESPFSKMPLEVDQVSLRGHAQLLPEYMKILTTEKNRILSQLERGHQENYFEKITQIFDEILKTMVEYETEINEIQEQLSFCLGRLEWLIENQQKKRSQLEGVCGDLIQRIKSSRPQKQELSRAYDAAEEELTTLATSTGTQLWQKFANNIVTSIETRLRDLVKF